MKSSTILLALLLTGSPDPVYGSADPQNGSVGVAAGGAIIGCTRFKPCRDGAVRIAKKFLPVTTRSPATEKDMPVAGSRAEAKTQVHKCLGLPKSESPYRQGRIDGKDEYWLFKYARKTYMILDHADGHEKGDVSPHLHGKVLKDGGKDDPADKSNWKDGSDKACHFRYKK